MRTAFKVRAHPTPAQAAVLNRTFGCVRLVWNKTLVWRHDRWCSARPSTNMPQANAYLTAMKRDPELEFLTEVSSVPLRQVLRAQQKSFANFFTGRARYPRSKCRTGRQVAGHTRSAFRWRDGQLRLAKMDSPLTFVSAGTAIGVDLGVTGLAVTSDGEKIANPRHLDRRVRAARTDFPHRVSTSLVRRYDTIMVEDLAVTNMVGNRRLARAISD